MTPLDPARVDWDKSGGLVPVVVQDGATLQVLMLGYMSREALEATQASGFVTFYSRSKERLWQKGETSGHRLELLALELDCDGDAILATVRPHGPACHRDTTSCFGEADAPGIGWLSRLESVVDARRTADPDESYTARLARDGVERVAKKVGEEGVEAAIAAVLDDGRLSEEAADLLYHLVVLLRISDRELSDVVEVLRARHDG